MTTRLCECGCGEEIVLKRKGRVSRFRHGHNMRGVKKSAEWLANISKGKTGKRVPKLQGERCGIWKGDEAGYHALHKWLAYWYPKKGECEMCGRMDGRTYYAFKFHPQRHTRKRQDYKELCASCHKVFDGYSRKSLV